MKVMRWNTVARWAAVIALVSSIQNGCSCRKAPISQRNEQRYNRVYYASLDTLNAPTNRSWDLRRPWYEGLFVHHPHLLFAVSHLPFEAHVHPLLLQWLADSSAAKVETLVVSYRDTVPIPAFPQFDEARPRGDAFNLAVRDSADSLVQRLVRARQPMHDSMTTRIASRGGVVLHSYYLSQIQVVTLPLSAVHWLVDTLAVSYVQPRHGGEVPPQPITVGPWDAPLTVRGEMSTEPYVPFSPQYGHAGLLDTGVYPDHELLKSTGRLLSCWDCVHRIDGGCIQVLRPWWSDPYNHGTSSSAILSGEKAGRSDAHTGVTQAQLNVYQVFSNGTSAGTLDAAGAIKALELAATVNLDRVILTEMQGLVSSAIGGVVLPDFNGITQMADRAYAATSAVIAPSGDFGPNLVAAPAIGRGVMAIGAWERSPMGPALYASQSYGLTSDQRNKPDVQAFTNTETANNGGPSSYARFGATSGAGPYAAGAAILLRNWLVQASGNSNIDAGQVYAQMILSGQTLPTTTTSPPSFDTQFGAGLLVLPTNGYCWFGKVDATPGVPIPEYLNAGGDATRMEAALWWEEPSLSDYQSGGGSSHCYLSLSLEGPDGVVTKSEVQNGVFQRLTRVASSGTFPAGQWTLRIKNETTGASYTPKAYWTVAYRR